MRFGRVPVRGLEGHEALCIAVAVQTERETTIRFAGRYCEQGDVLIEEVPLPPVVPGDFIVVPVAGAYHLAMASNYNAIPRPVVLAARDGTARVIRRRKTFDDLLRCEVDA